MNDMPDFAGFLQRMADEREGAAAEVFDRYADKLVGYARGRMSSKLRQKIDPEEVVQSALKSFFRGPHAALAGQTLAPTDSTDDGTLPCDELWGLLVVITLRKCLKYIKLFGRCRRDLNREVAGPATDEEMDGLLQLIDRQPTPAEEAVLNDTIAKLSEGLTVSECEMLKRRLEGETVAEIAEQCQCGKRTVERLLAKLRDALRAENDASVG